VDHVDENTYQKLVLMLQNVAPTKPL